MQQVPCSRYHACKHADSSIKNVRVSVVERESKLGNGNRVKTYAQRSDMHQQIKQTKNCTPVFMYIASLHKSKIGYSL